MKSLCAIIIFCALCVSVQAQTALDPTQDQQPQTQAPSAPVKTIPVMRAGGTTTDAPSTAPQPQQVPQPATETAPAAIPHLVITKPVPESEIQPKPLPHQTSPADEAIRKEADEAITARAEEVSDACETPIKARIDWTTISPQEINQNSPANSCGAALDAIVEMCQNSAGRDRVEADIKTVICTAGPQPSVNLHGGTLVYTLDWQSRQPGAFVYGWLAQHL